MSFSFYSGRPSDSMRTTIKSVSIQDLSGNNLTDHVKEVLKKVAGLRETDIKTVQHKNGWCTWSELMSVPGMKYHEYDIYGDRLVDFFVYGEGWMLTLDQDSTDEFYSRWVFVAERTKTNEHCVPKLGTIIEKRYIQPPALLVNRDNIETSRSFTMVEDF